MAFAAKRLWQFGQWAVLLFVLTGAFSRPALAAERPYTFTQEGHRYTFTSTFVVDASPDAVLDVLYPFPNLAQYSRTASAVELLDTGPDWQTVRFTYATWLWSMSTSFRRELDRPHYRIRFRMIEARRTGLRVPLPTASSGEYRVEAVDGGGVRVTYRQMAETQDSLLIGPWMARAHVEAVLFSQDLEAYVHSKLH